MFSLALFFRIFPFAKLLCAKLFKCRIADAIVALESIPPDKLSRTVLVASILPHGREIRLAAAAKLAGWNPMLVYIGQPKYKPSEHFDVSTKVKSLFDLALVSWRFQGAVIHLFAPNGAQAYLLCRTKIRPLILDIYDTSSGMSVAPAVWKNCERGAIQSADAMIHRDLRVRYLQTVHNYVLPRDNIFIHDPFPENEFRNISERKENEIRVVSVGWVARGDNSLLRSIRALCAHNIHVHLYVNPYQHEDDPELNDYLALQQQSVFFHIETPVYGKTYREHLARYDFGLAIFEPYVFGETPKSYTDDYLRGCGSSRIIDYIQMGLGVIVSPGTRFQYLLARRYATIAVLATREFLHSPRPILEAALAKKKSAKPKVIAAITIGGVAHRLGAFYSQVASTKIN
jgi:hypothetical protein